MFGLCQYKDSLGIPGQGVHSTRLFGVAIIDVIMTIVGAYLLSYWMKWDFLKTAGGAFLLGIALHRAFCVRTTVDKLLFPNVKDA